VAVVTQTAAAAARALCRGAAGKVAGLSGRGSGGKGSGAPTR